ncbi:hypothetical protein K7432_005357 [Basidiobolus ranarum]|uniref:Uncharacterized protein n=1 Tax=Basidiobolus ranarum TaxID=34480 RepID=A0ABR2WWS2_9FUNG
MDQLRVNISASTGYIQQTFATLFVNENIGVICPLSKPITPIVQAREDKNPIKVAELPKITKV